MTLTHTQFCIMNWLFRKYWFIGLCRSSKCWQSIGQYAKITLVKFTIEFIKKKFWSTRTLSGSWWRIQAFHNSNSHLKVQILSVVFLKVTSFLTSFPRKCLPTTIAWLSVQFSSVAQSCPTLCDLMNRSTPGLPVHHHLPEFTHTHVHWISDATQPSHPLSSPSPPDLNLSQHQGLFQWVSSSHQVAKGLEFQLQHQSFQWTPRTDLL